MAVQFLIPTSPTSTERRAKDALESYTRRWADRCGIRFHIGSSALAIGDLSFARSAFSHEDGYAVRQIPDGAALDVLVAGRGMGTLYAAYAWLQRQGWSFHVHGDVEPDAAGPTDLSAFTIARHPRFAWRGLQLWNYWWPGRDSWSYADYEAYLNQFPKLGLNHFDFPLYWYEPLFTGVRFAGVPLRRLRLSGADVALARIGGEALAGRQRFTSPEIPEDAPDDDRTEAARNLLRRVLAHARGLGLRTTIGIEPGNVALVDPSLLRRIPADDLYERGLLVQPSSPSGMALARARLEALFTSFPDVDVYAIWQSEMGPWRSTSGSPHPADVSFRRAHANLADRITPGDFDQLQWLRHCADIAVTLKPGARLSTGGWGAERLMTVADEVLPPSMIRATIADYEPEFGLRRGAFKAYGETRRERCHTTWSEVDQHLWIQQPKVSATSRVLDELEAHGVEGASQLHWRNLFNDPDLYGFAQGCWSDGRSADELALRWATAKFGADAAADAVRGLAALQAFNAGIVARTPDVLHSSWWVGFDCFMGGLLSANRYLDGGPVSAKYHEDAIDPLLASAPEAEGHLNAAVLAYEAALDRRMSVTQRRRLAFWHNRALYSRDLYRAHVNLARAVKLASDTTDHDRLSRALALVVEADAERVVRDFASCLGEDDVAERGELGLLLTLNVKFLGSAKRLEGLIRRRLGGEPAETPRGVFDARAGLRLPQRVYQSFFELLHVAAGPWEPGCDDAHGQAGFSHEVIAGAVGRLSPTEGVWSDPERLVMRLTGHAGWTGVLDLYFYQEPDWDTPFRVQDVLVNGQIIARGLQDFYGRGVWCDEGIWLSVAVAFPSAGHVEIACVRRGGGDARLSRLVLREA